MDLNHPLKESIVFSHKMALLSKALWKSVEKDWQAWIKPFHLNLNEHHILWIAYQLNGATISDIASHGVMHVSTAFNFSKKLEARGLLSFSKKKDDKRNTYICLTDSGRQLFLETMRAFNEHTYHVYQGAVPMKELYGKFPEFSELICIVRHIYGTEFIEQFDACLTDFQNDVEEKDGYLKLASANPFPLQPAK